MCRRVRYRVAWPGGMPRDARTARVVALPSRRPRRGGPSQLTAMPGTASPLSSTTAGPRTTGPAPSRMLARRCPFSATAEPTSCRGPVGSPLVARSQLHAPGPQAGWRRTDRLAVTARRIAVSSSKHRPRRAAPLTLRAGDGSWLRSVAHDNSSSRRPGTIAKSGHARPRLPRRGAPAAHSRVWTAATCIAAPRRPSSRYLPSSGRSCVRESRRPSSANELRRAASKIPRPANSAPRSHR